MKTLFMDIYSKPLADLKTIKSILDFIKTLDIPERELFKIEKSEKAIILLRSIHSINFFFEVNSSMAGIGDNVHEIHLAPYNEDTHIAGYTRHLNREAVINRLKIWIDNLKSYISYNSIVADLFADEYEEEIFNAFEFEDDGTLDSQPINSEAQIKLNEFLNQFAGYIESVQDYAKSPQLQDIARESRNLADEIPKLTKRQTFKRFSKIFGKVKAHSLNMFKAFCDVAKKEVLKSLFYEGVDTGMQLISEASTFFHIHHLPHP